MVHKYIALQEGPLLDVLQQLFPEKSKTSVRSLIKRGLVFVNHQCALLASHKVHKGAIISIDDFKPHLLKKLNILYEDSFLIVVEKPSGLLSVASAFQKKETAYALLRKHYYPKGVFVVHRLDQDTSGIMLFAKTEETQKELKRIFERHDIERKYIALVEGVFSAPRGTWSSYLKEDKNYKVFSTNKKDGELAITHFSIKQSGKKYTLMEFSLETGKKNQIRVHCQDALHPIVGDKKYGAKTNPLGRLGLHSYYIGFTHPKTNKRVSFTSNPPKSFYLHLK